MHSLKEEALTIPNQVFFVFLYRFKEEALTIPNQV